MGAHGCYRLCSTRLQHHLQILDVPGIDAVNFEPIDYAVSKQLKIDYVLIGDNERANYSIDFDYFESNFDVFYQNDSVIIYRVQF